MGPDLTMPLGMYLLGVFTTATTSSVLALLVEGRRRRRIEAELGRARRYAAGRAQLADQLWTALSTLSGAVHRPAIAAQVVAGSDLPPRGDGVDPPAPVVLEGEARAYLPDLDGAYDTEPTPDDTVELPQDETRVTSLGQPGDGGIGHRYDWPHFLGGQPLPERSPWRSPAGWLRTAATLMWRQAVGRWEPGDRWQQWCDRLRVALLSAAATLTEATVEYAGRYRRVPRHADTVLHTRSWSEIADDRVSRWMAEARVRAAQTRRLVRYTTVAQQPVRRTMPPAVPALGCTP